MLHVIPVAFWRHTPLSGLLFKTHLLVHFALQLHDLVLHANVQFLVALHGTGLNLELFQLAFGHHSPEAALKVDDGMHAPLVAGTSQPAPDPLLNDYCFVLIEYLQRRVSASNVRPWTRLKVRFYQPTPVRQRIHKSPKGKDTKAEGPIHYVDCTYHKYMDEQNIFKSDLKSRL